jgi:hypothetical protein
MGRVKIGVNKWFKSNLDTIKLVIISFFIFNIIKPITIYRILKLWLKKKMMKKPRKKKKKMKKTNKLNNKLYKRLRNKRSCQGKNLRWLRSQIQKLIRNQFQS